MVEPDDKFNKLVEFLKARKSQKHLIFMNTCACVQYFSGILKEYNFRTYWIESW